MAAITPLKRQREEQAAAVEHENTKIEKDAHEESQETKRQKSSYNHILSLLDNEEEEEEEEPTQDISSLVTTLQQEISSEASPCLHAQENNLCNIKEDYACDSSPSSSCSKEDEEDDKESVMRHLLEASDDELGLPNSTEQFSLHNYVGEEQLFDVNSSDILPFGDGLWEFEDEAANYYTMLHSELFL